MNFVIRIVLLIILPVSLVSCNKESGIYKYLSLDMPFDTVVTSANGSNNMMIRSIKENHEIGSRIISLRSFIYDHDGAYCSAARIDSLISRSEDTIVYHFGCDSLKDTIYRFNGKPIKFRIPINEMAWDKTDCLKEDDGWTCVYDSLGHLVMKSGYGIKIDYYYEENGSCVLEKRDNGFHIITEEKSYNKRGALKNIICRLDEAIDYTLVNKYNRKGKIKKQRQQMYEDGLLQKGSYICNTYKYDNHGRMIENHEIFKINNNAINNRDFVYEYNDNVGSITMRTINILHPEGIYSDIFRYYSYSKEQRESEL